MGLFSFSLSKTHAFPVATCTCVLWFEGKGKSKKKWTGLLSDLRILFLLLISSCYTPLLPSEMALCYGLALIKNGLFGFTQIPTRLVSRTWGQKTKQKDGLHRSSQTGLARLVLYQWRLRRISFVRSTRGWTWMGGRWTGLLSFCRFLSLVCCFPNGVPRFYFFFFRLILLLLPFFLIFASLFFFILFLLAANFSLSFWRAEFSLLFFFPFLISWFTFVSEQ